MSDRFKTTSSMFDSLELHKLSTKEGVDMVIYFFKWLNDCQHECWNKSLKMETEEGFGICMAVYFCLAELGDYITGLRL